MVERFDLVAFEDRDDLWPAKNGPWVRYSDHEAELSALNKQVEELMKALNRKVDEKCAAVQARTRAEAEVTALRKALIEARAVVDAVTGHNQPDRPWSRQVRDRIDAALASTRETSDAD